MYYAVLGPLRLVVDGEPLSMRSRNLSIILTTLLVRAGSVVTVDDLIREVWTQPPQRARDAIYVNISKLRRTLGDMSQDGVLRSRYPGYVMRPHDGQLDLQVFHRHRVEGHRYMANGDYLAAVHAWKAGLSLCRGTPLGGAHCGTGPILGSFDSWLQQSRAECVELAAWSQLRGGLCHSAISFLTLHLAQYPLNEILHQQLMLAFFLSRHRAQSLGVFQRACRVLADELGVGPSRDLQVVRDIVLTDDVGRAERVLASAVASSVSSLRPSGELWCQPDSVD
ncbi:AfsR/SARP family transcriptional regulator [Streptomyces mobaraensis NBRC 13819 = DSM 40847]|uniref:SARP family transcriptional regulator n=1 Tax=Streptomyces mobaraensis (strain ATCC 29032 / DSM 40847 / JCM 4168 / NBRC 13819 / NCIMB 11159 / IPCR 16-22) TaxID=1223523 RepID=M3BNL5_STRM1|nr:AfsR/SARP family transcriptional regulator [Streptomyces mobaraensis]EMF01230.1 SARP family transcriptional regulator [Streptomyces mobaraensis NBRC 13819 = DSM 40847]QTT76624.1 AfsR/SARP family transcriptional regulator [Streptomyces mobaraensis NBRC 13819 = DSM 40847]